MRSAGTHDRFSQRHPFLFGVMMIIMAVALIAGAMAFFRSVGLTPGSIAGSDKIGVVYVEEMILSSSKVVSFIQALKEDKSIKGVLLRVNSPGGAIAPSQEIYQAVKELNAVKPVVASYGSVAASGGYYCSVPARLIFANPGSITGSIGVMAEFVTVTEAMEKLGIKPEVLATGKYKAAGTPLRELSFEQREQMIGLMQDLHEQFVDHVAEARGMDRARIAAIADGRAVSGRQALALGLVDQIGSMSQAMDKLKELAEIEGRASLVEGPVEEKTLIQEILGSIKFDISSSLPGWSFSYK
ncbi:MULTISPECIES: signal peptide peptidase SppA [unclassified Pseudodesulfovibrio]|uniref:signal peptide peptidase SppA n=1 Tax=unclassified Pseudodesulfovibrio TaxID=2661612 RepID=UPI000FEBF77F|nr:MULTISPECIES: signal peptide peptidase SppA [unclassified Pseudodesulfovibrio]MCJ2165465.1 signal peptide peptidase SppA [Pseudodesulfovibrio sp. S3-i]RWU03213.1 signal peptide peptidase SppA [Pseudodesulfovibrio sp. S3]